MALNWIVPARRLVVASERQTYADVLDGWLEQLRQHRDKLLDWYSPLVEGRDLGRGFDRAVELLGRWKDWFMAGSPSEAGHAVVTGSSQTLDSLDFRVRIWKGPLRVLKEAEIPPPPPPDPPPRRPPPPPVPPPPELTTIDVGGSLPLLIDGVQRVVNNHDAVFLPGDVLELPIFRLWWLAGIGQFANARFATRGSCWLGTSVADGPDQTLGVVPLHDNLLAMRFQLLLSSARGAFSSLESSWNAGSIRDKSPMKTVERIQVHARGFIYGGSLLDPCKGDHYEYADGHWGDSQVPGQASLNAMAANTRLTTGWACSPCGLALASYLTHETGSWRGGSVNRCARDPAGPSFVIDNGELDFFHQRIPGNDEATLRACCERRGLDGEPSTARLRELAFLRLFGRPLPPRVRPPVVDAPVVDADDDEAPSDPAVGEPAVEAPVTGDAEVDLSDLFPGEGDPDARAEPDHDVVRPVDRDPFDLAAMLPGDTNVSRSKQELLDYLDGAAFATIGLDGHEFHWVVLHAADTLLDEPVGHDARGRSIPPTVGKLSAFDPLDGTPYVESGAGPDPWVFEATGHFRPTNLVPDDLHFTVFDVRPFRWEPFEGLTVRREVEMQGRGDERHEVEVEIQIGESGPRVTWGTLRDKNLLSITRFSLERLQAIHRASNTYEPVVLERAGGRAFERALARAAYHDRAVPGPTLAESNAMDAYNDQATAQRGIDGHVHALRPVLQRMDRIKRHRQRDDEAWMGTMLPNFARVLQTTMQRLRAANDAEIASLTATIRRLRTRLDDRYEPDAGRTRELQPVEERSSFRRALSEADTARTRLVAELDAAHTTGRRRTRALADHDRPTRDEHQLDAALRSLRDHPDSATADWHDLGLRSVAEAAGNAIRPIYQSLTGTGE
jgi:hypothetical protein